MLAHLPANLLGTPKNVQTDRQMYGENTELVLCYGHVVDLLDAIDQGDLMSLIWELIRVYKD